MVVYNAATRELTAKIVYYGPGLGGKTTNLQVLHDRLEPGTVGKLLNLSTQTDRTIYFDLLPVELGDIKGYKIRFQLATVPGQTAFNETRRVVLKGTDGIVFVADSQWTMLPKNLESWQNLKDNLKVNGVSFEGIPIVVQYNKRDLGDILSVDAMQEALSLSSYPFVEAVASAGRGVTETFKLISKLTFVDLLRRLQGRRPEDAVPASAPPRNEKEDLLSWRNSLLNRPAAGGGTGARAPLSVVPSIPEDGPFETEEPGLPESPGGHDDPFAPPEVEATASFGSGSREPARSAAPERQPASEERSPTIPGPDGTDRPAPVSEQMPHERPQPAEEPEIPSDGLSGEAVLPALVPADVGTRLSVLEERVEGILGERKESGPEEDARRASDEEVVRSLSELSRRLDSLEGSFRSVSELFPRLDSLDESFRSVSEVSRRLDSLEGEFPRMAVQEERLQGLGLRIEAGERRLDSQEQRLGTAERLLDTQERRQRALEDDAGMALRSLSERAEKLQQQVSSLSALIDLIQSGLEEKTSQGRREAEDIRTQIAPLLEAHGQRHEEDERLFRELDRLRESLAESLGELSDRLRRAVRGA